MDIYTLLIILLLVLTLSMIYKNNNNDNKDLEKYTNQLQNIGQNTSYIDSALQYNITNNSKRNYMLSQFQSTQAMPSPPKKEDIDSLRKELNDWYNQNINNLKPMDKWGKISIEAALDSASMTNWPIGNVICYMPEGTQDDPTKWIEILRGGNRFFTSNPNDLLSIENYKPRFNSGGHGEMVVLNAFEENLSKGMYDKSSPNYIFDKSNPIDFRKRGEFGYGMPDNIVLFTQLNSCQMCLSRIGNSGISRCYWIAPDTAGGLAHKLCDSVPAYFNMLNRQVHGVADVSHELIDFAFRAFAGPNGEWVNYCTVKLGILGSPSNMEADYKYCPGQYYANNEVGQNTIYDWSGFFRTVDLQGGPSLSCNVKAPN